MTERKRTARSPRASRGKAETRGQRNIRWIETHCRIPEGKLVGKPLLLTKEQKKWILEIYDSPTRTFILSMARKNAKTALAACLLLLHLCGPESKVNSQLYSAAQSREQAAILFGLAAKMVRMSPDLVGVVIVRDSSKQLACPELGTLYRALSADASTAYGLSPAFVVHDELGQVRGPRSELYEALETAAAAQESPLSIIISTQAPNDADLLSTIIDDAKTGSDPRVKLVLYEAPKDADPFTDDAIRAANPHFDSFMNKEEVRRQAEEARRLPSRESSYRNLILNQRVSAHSPFIARSTWDSCGAEVVWDTFHAATVTAAIDLSARNDLTALAIAAEDEEGVVDIHVEFFAPESGIAERSRRDRVPYDLWAQQGYITLTPGGSVDYAFVAERMMALSSDFQINEIAFDRWRIDVLKVELARIGAELPLAPFGQGFKDMSPAVDEFESLLLNKRIRHGNNPVLNWCAANAIAVRDPAGNRKLDKSKATGRIDGLIAALMAIGRRAQHEEQNNYVTGRLIAL